MKNKKYNRRLRNFLINREAQLKITLMNLLYLFVIILITLAILLSPLLFDMFFSHEIDIQYKAAQTFLILMQRFVPAIFLMSVLMFIHQIIFTHRIFGPLVNFKHTFAKIGRGDLTRRIQLRKEDYLREEAEKINWMIDSLSTFVENKRFDTQRLLDLSKEIESQVQDSDVQKRISELIEILQKPENLLLGIHPEKR